MRENASASTHLPIDLAQYTLDEAESRAAFHDPATDQLHRVRAQDVVQVGSGEFRRDGEQGRKEDGRGRTRKLDRVEVFVKEDDEGVHLAVEVLKEVFGLGFAQDA
jgi:hypothetical protein